MAAAVHHPPRFTSISTMKNEEASAPTNGSYFLEDGIISSMEEMEKMKQDAKLQLRELLAGETRLKCPDNDAFLVKFLRARKYNVDSAFKNIKKYFKVRRDHPELFVELDPDFNLFDTVCRKHKLVTLSREKDSKGRAIILLNLGTWNSGICSLDNFFRVGTALVEHLLLNDEVQLNGVVFVMDFKNLGIYHLTQYTIPVIKRLFSLMQASE
ncbi:alpha-tocopherol transfer protein [Rhipicephalus sanguineus]|uniref:alpha-tocopherol transfer protein n=1 Tax=Rhipicephalus sanguineus TaxID=34632 RepID=UPI0020C3DBCA|nr:alpha-tocopherol transfer protein [Rhipicephalus sanguineus]